MEVSRIAAMLRGFNIGKASVARARAQTQGDGRRGSPSPARELGAKRARAYPSQGNAAMQESWEEF